MQVQKGMIFKVFQRLVQQLKQSCSWWQLVAEEEYKNLDKVLLRWIEL